MFSVSQICVIALIIVAAIVMVLQLWDGNRYRTWQFVVLYWFLLTLKNVCDYFGW